jgi:hypothetical protein
MRLGFLLGFLIGAGVASLISSSESSAPGEDTVAAAEPRSLVGKLKRHADEARAEARKASEEKQAEMLRDWEQSRRGSRN